MFTLDQFLFQWLTAATTSPGWLLDLAAFATRQLPILLLAGMAGAFIVGDREIRRGVARVLAAMVVAWLLARVFKHLLPMPRPFTLGLGRAWLEHGGSASFPSSHASVAFAFGATIAAIASRWYLAGSAIVAACLVAWSRIYLGLHFPSDVLAGVGVGACSAWVSRWLSWRLPEMRAVW